MSMVWIGVGAIVIGGGISAYGSYTTGKQQKAYNNYLAETSEKQGEIEYKIGMKESEMVQDAAKYEGKQHAGTTAQFASKQKARMIANGIDLSSVTSEDILSETISKSTMDELMIRFNAASKSWSIEESARYKKWASKQQALGYTFQGKAAARSANIAATGQVFQTIGSAAGVGAKAGGSSSSSTESTTSIRE